MHALRGVDLEVAQGAFVALMGPVGAGKSTLCLSLNGAIPHVVEGDLDGTVIVGGRDTREATMGQLAAQVGLVLEEVETQLFNASVADEVAFGLEGLGLPPAEIEARLGPALLLVGLAGFDQRVPRTLSGGEQKRLALAAVLAMQPRLLVLDEPTSGLDPRGRHAVLAAIDRMRRDHRRVAADRRGAGDRRGMTVVMATQDAEAAARFADRVLVLQQGRIALDGSPEQVFAQVERLDEWGIDVPQLARLAHRLEQETGRAFWLGDPGAARRVLEAQIGSGASPQRGTGVPLPQSRPEASPPPAAARGAADLSRGAADLSRSAAIEVRALCHHYPGAPEPALYGVDLDVRRGEWLAIVGVNGSGKSTLVRHLNGLLRPTEGQVIVEGQDTRASRVGELARVVSYLPQNPGLLLFSATVRREVGYGPRQLGLRGAALEARVSETLELLGLSAYAEHPPAVLGYGLRRQVALASVLAMEAPILALDEPTVGLDRGAAGCLLDVIAERHRRGTGVVMISHDLRWVARYAERVAVLYGGRLVRCGPCGQVLSDLDLLGEVGLDPLPVTALAGELGLSPPLPLGVDELLERVSNV